MQPSTARNPSAARAHARGPDFIGIGAQRSGTSWIYACLFEHPELCLPRKEINFFSRERNWKRGFGWYEGIFAECPPDAIAGEFSTSYLTDAETAGRIHGRYPEARLIVSLRNPADRAYSNYLNDIVAGVVSPDQGFAEARRSHPEYIEGGRYAQRLRPYLELFARERILVSIFDDARRDPRGAIQAIYRFLEVDEDFRPSLLERRVGVGRIPRRQALDRWLIDAAAAFRRRKLLRPIWWRLKKAGVGDRLRALNTASEDDAEKRLDAAERRSLIEELEPDNRALEEILGTELPAWRE